MLITGKFIRWWVGGCLIWWVRLFSFFHFCVENRNLGQLFAGGRKVFLGVLLWGSGFRIRHCHRSGFGTLLWLVFHPWPGNFHRPKTKHSFYWVTCLKWERNPFECLAIDSAPQLIWIDFLWEPQVRVLGESLYMALKLGNINKTLA